MAEKTFYDEIVECLNIQRKQLSGVTISEEVLKEFFRDMPRQQTARRQETVQPIPPAISAPAVHQQTTQYQTPPPAVHIPPQQEICGASPDEISRMNWDELAAAVAACRNCQLCESRLNTVFEDGSRTARLLFFGEGPGADEDAQGVPFVGRAGELLTKMINAMQFSREEVYICNTVKCRPPNNRNPEPAETEACRAYALRQIELVKPEVIVVLGAVPLHFLFPRVYGGIKKLRGNWLDYNGIKVMPTYHPAYLLRDPKAKGEAWKDLQQVMAVFGKKHTPERRA